ncbi:MAG TPA: bifunctional [glutamate--ammonia ligase]-adenylyl-L-tyrosine phosphorylase/[glutamate--ammonia-ligase] adenylyltransferase, partial [Pseudomonadales bacterium]|nr:bifunctional [glutamate--ammonia ligase]-adenylyl-L-tyrosine phosphorylase/[glutamate--ammonia-ligase] adenylyltransferase [Pseudomonadales bacterium]
MSVNEILIKHRQDLQEKCAFWDELSAVQLAQLDKVLVASDYVAEQFKRRPEMLQQVLASPCLNQPRSEADFREALKQQLEGCFNDDDLMRRVRIFRHQEMCRIIWRDINKLAQMPEVTRELSYLAESLIDESLTLLYAWACRDFGTPFNARGEQQKLCVIGMGKLGAYELNLSSDIDLIFCFPESGETQGEGRSWDNHEFFIRLGQRLIKVIDAKTAEGFAFRVDMRLRPYGQSGALVMNFASMNEYYQDQGREWERYAMIKARIVGGDYVAGNRLLEDLKPFVYRRYIDFSVISALRELKASINAEVKRKGSEDNIKIGPGGIREIEFMAQACQLIRGGREPELQERGLLNVLQTLKQKKLFPADVVDELSEAYVFLRDLEHRIQAVQDKQTQSLPKLATERERVANAMGFASWEGFLPELDRRRRMVQHHFEQFISINEDKQPVNVWQQLWLEPTDKSAEELSRLGFENGDDTQRRLFALRDSRAVANLQQISRDRLNKLMPALLQSVSRVSQPSETFARILPLIEAVLRRSAYMVLLIENPKALEHLSLLCANSPWISETLARYPILLDQLLNEATLFLPPQLAELKADLKQQLAIIPSDDLERKMEVLRHFKRAHQLRVAASDLHETLPLMKVSDYLTWLAEAILQEVLAMAWDELAKKHGVP